MAKKTKVAAPEPEPKELTPEDRLKRGMALPDVPMHPDLVKATQDVAALADERREEEATQMQRVLSLSCPRCQSPFTSVRKRRSKPGWFQRTRLCASCGHLFRTRENPIPEDKNLSTNGQ